MEIVKAKHTFVDIKPSTKYTGNVLTHTYKTEDGVNFYVTTSVLMPGGDFNKYYADSRLQGVLVAADKEGEVKKQFRGDKIESRKAAVQLAQILRGIEVNLSVEGKRVLSISPVVIEKPSFQRTERGRI